MRIRHLSLLLTLLALGFKPGASADRDNDNSPSTQRLAVGEFSKAKLDGWETQSFTGETFYRLTQVNERSVLKAESRSAASGLVKKTTVDLTRFPYLNWSWRVERRLRSGVDEQQKAGDDYAARVYVIVNEGLFGWNIKAINYVWSDRYPKESVWPNAFVGRRAMMFVLRAPEDQSSRWYQEKRNLYRDFVKVFGSEIREINAVAIMTDTDNTQGQAIAYYGDIYFTQQ